jgi:cytochrome c-type biogenesis protein CcmH
MFYVIAALMVVFALAFVLVPILLASRREGDNNAVSVESANLEVFRQQRRELEAEFARGAGGLASQAEYDAAVDELASRAAAEVNAKDGDKSTPSAKNAAKPSWMLGFVISLFIVVTSVLGYVQWGDHEARKLVNAPAVTAETFDPNAPMSDRQVLAMVDNLAKKMQENPNDPKGWILLARSQQALGQFGSAVDAFGRAAALTPLDAQLLADYADAQAMVQEGNFEGKPRELIAQALKADAKNMKALALAATAEMRAGNKAGSLKYWEQLKALVPKDSEDFAQVNAIITEIKTGKPAFPANAAPPSATPPIAPPTTQEASAGKSISGEINIAPELKTKIAKGDTLFVFARAAAGPKMPLAVLRVPAPTTWPFRYTLTDAMAMAPNMNLSSFAEVTIEARISKSGNAQPASGDMQGASAAVKNDARQVSVTIAKVVP